MRTARTGSILLNISFFILIVLFLIGPPRNAAAPSGSVVSVVFSQFHPYVLLFLALVAWRRWTDGSAAFRRIAAVRVIGAIEHWLVFSPRAVYLVTAGCAVVMVAVSVRRHVVFESRGDLAIYAHGLWNTVHGVFHRSSLINDESLFAAHFEPLHLVLAPLYVLAPSPVTLLVIQALVIALGAVPLYWIARRHLPEHPRLWPVFPVAYLFFAPLRTASRFDYHPSAMVPTLFLFALYFMDRQRWGMMGFFLVMAGLLKENMPAAGVTAGLYVAIVQRRRVLGAVIAAVFALWFYAGIVWIIPSFSPIGYVFFGNYASLGNSFSEYLRSLFFNPRAVIASLTARAGWKLSYILGVFGPLGLLPLVSPEGLFLGVPFFSQHLLATTRAQVSLLTHNSAEVVAFVFFGAVLGARRLLARIPTCRWASAAWTSERLTPILAIVLWSATVLFAQWSEVSYLRQYPDTARARALDAALRLIPDNAAVAAPERVLPHLTRRHRLYHFPPQWNVFFPDSSSRHPDFVVVDPTYLSPSQRAEQNAALDETRREGYRLVFERDGISVWTRSTEHARLW